MRCDGHLVQDVVVVLLVVAVVVGGGLVAQCSATPATVAATPQCSATPFQTQISVRHLPAQGGGRCDT